ncbi:MAG: guanosine polyphosphate pyrophosphohydrolase [Lachnospiraceae bacterium]|nr:guanosine polyphosphate pyrophosphohydrolase [Lachnospiraceae bacterium]
MVKLNDYLYTGDTVLKILHDYAVDLRLSSTRDNNLMDMVHSNFLIHYTELLEHNEFLTSQSERILEFYMYMTQEYPFLAFTFRGRIKSLVRTEEKYNGYIVSSIYDAHKKGLPYPTVNDLTKRLRHFRDLIAYRIVISIPACHLHPWEKREDVEERYLYDIANDLPEFMEARGFTPELSGKKQDLTNSPLNEKVRPYYRDYIMYPKATGYRSLHITFYDNEAQAYLEIQLRTKEMDDFAEIGMANHAMYEKAQEKNRARRTAVPVGECRYFDDAWERVTALQNLDLANIDVNMFTARDNRLINDACGFYRGRLILPYEHLSRFQNDQIDVVRREDAATT